MKHYWYGGEVHGKEANDKCETVLYRLDNSAFDLKDQIVDPPAPAHKTEVWKHAVLKVNGEPVHVYVAPEEYSKLWEPTYTHNMEFLKEGKKPPMKRQCFECGYHSMRDRPLTETLVCPECGVVVTYQMYEQIEVDLWKKSNPDLLKYVNLDVHITQYLFDQSYLSHLLSNEEMKIFFKQLMKEYSKPTQPKFNYRERAAVEFDCDEPQFRSDSNSGGLL